MQLPFLEKNLLAVFLRRSQLPPSFFCRESERDFPEVFFIAALTRLRTRTRALGRLLLPLELGLGWARTALAVALGNVDSCDERATLNHHHGNGMAASTCHWPSKWWLRRDSTTAWLARR